MNDDDLATRAARDIAFDSIGAGLNRRAESSQGVFRG